MSGVLARIEGRVLRATTFRSSRAAGSAAGSGRGGRLSEKMRKRICCLRFRANRHQGCDARLVARAQASGLLESEHQEKSPIPLAATGAVRIPLAANTTGSHTGSQYHWQPLAYRWHTTGSHSTRKCCHWGCTRRRRFARIRKRFQGTQIHRRTQWRRPAPHDGAAPRESAKRVLDPSGSSDACSRSGSESARCDPATVPPSGPPAGRRRSRRG